MLIEEISPYSSPVNDSTRSFIAGNTRNEIHTVPCYGLPSYAIYRQRPVLCSGTIIGTREGILPFLSVLVNEFHNNNNKQNVNCKSPSTTDQWIMNWLYYNGKFGYKNIATLPWGFGPVLTAGKACITKDRKPGAHDIVRQDSEGFILNEYDHKRSPVVHQFDRCGQWIENEIFKKYPQIYL